MLLPSSLSFVVCLCFIVAISMASASQIDLKEGKDVEFVYSLKQGTNWGLQFQVVEGYVAVKV